MNRRSVLGLVAAATTGGCLAGLPGATGPRNPPTPSSDRPSDAPTLRVTSLDIEETDGGRLRVIATVENDGEAAATRTLTLTVSIDDEEYVQSREVRVGAGSTVDAAVEFELTYDEFTGNGSVSADLS